MITEQRYEPCTLVYEPETAEIIEYYQGQVITLDGINYDLEQTVSESDMIIVMMVTYWDNFVVPIADHIINNLVKWRG